MTSVLATDAGTMLCPLAKTFGKADTGKCRGPACACWRWMPMSARDPRYVSAVQREVALLKVDRPTSNAAVLHKEAVKKVQQDPNAYTFPDEKKDRGYCGVGGPV